MEKFVAVVICALLTAPSSGASNSPHAGGLLQRAARLGDQRVRVQIALGDLANPGREVGVMLDASAQQAELVALDVLHHEARLVVVIGRQ